MMELVVFSFLTHLLTGVFNYFLLKVRLPHYVLYFENFDCFHCLKNVQRKHVESSNAVNIEKKKNEA